MDLFKVAFIVLNKSIQCENEKRWFTISMYSMHIYIYCFCFCLLLALFLLLQTDREPPLQPLRVSYFTLDDVRKDASRLISPWVKALVCFPCRQRGTFPMTFLQMHWQIGLDESNMCAKSSHFPLDYPYLEQKTQAFCCFHFKFKEVVTSLSNFPLKTFFFFLLKS